MVKYGQTMAQLERKLAAEDCSSLADRLRLYEAMLAQARLMGAVPSPDPLAGLDVDVRLAEAINVLVPAPDAGERP
jgi:hypothetical protein